MAYCFNPFRTFFFYLTTSVWGDGRKVFKKSIRVI